MIKLKLYRLNSSLDLDSLSPISQRVYDNDITTPAVCLVNILVNVGNMNTQTSPPVTHLNTQTSPPDTHLNTQTSPLDTHLNTHLFGCRPLLNLLSDGELYFIS